MEKSEVRMNVLVWKIFSCFFPLKCNIIIQDTTSFYVLNKARNKPRLKSTAQLFSLMVFSELQIIIILGQRGSHVGIQALLVIRVDFLEDLVSFFEFVSL
jgi:hypothetical protein